MRYTLLLLFSLGYCISSLAQLNVYNISDYARPDLERRTANLGFDMDINALQFRSSGKTTASLFDLDLDFRQSKFVNSARHQINARNRVELTSFNNKDYNSDARKGQHTIIALERTYNRKTFNAQEKFWELEYTTEANAINRSNEEVIQEIINGETNISLRDLTRREKNVLLEIGVSRGNGRIELISDAWHAKTILEILESKGLVEGKLSPEIIQAFAETISDIKNTRNTDFRLERISELEALNEFVQAQAWAKTEDFRFFPTLLDRWDYEAFQFRFSGKEFKYGLRPGISFRDLLQVLDDSEESNFQYLNYSLQAEVAYNTYKPISDDWQLNNENSLRLTPTISQPTSQSQPFPTTIDANWVGVLSSSWEWQFLPSLRSYYSLSVTGQLVSRGVNFLENFSINLSGEYVHYFSPKFNIRIEGGLTIFDYFYSISKPTLYENLGITTSYRFY